MVFAKLGTSESFKEELFARFGFLTPRRTDPRPRSNTGDNTFLKYYDLNGTTQIPQLVQVDRKGLTPLTQSQESRFHRKRVRATSSDSANLERITKLNTVRNAAKNYKSRHKNIKSHYKDVLSRENIFQVPDPPDQITDAPDHSFDLDSQIPLGYGDESSSSKDDSFQNIDVNPNLLETDKSLLWGVLSKFKGVFQSAWGMLNDGRSMKIPLKKDAVPRAQAPFRNSPRAKKVLDEVLGEMKRKKRVQASSSPWSSPVFVVYNHGKPRMVIDFRYVNDQVERDSYPIPRQDKIFDAIKGAMFISCFDLTKGFYQIPIHPDSRYITAFSSHRGLEELTVSVMGYKNSPAFFQRLMDELLASFRWQSAIAYIDDLIVWSNSIEQHAVDIAKVLKVFQDKGLTLAASKAHVGYSEIQALGHKVGRLGLGTLESKVQAMVSMRAPTNIKELTAVLGCFNYYRHFVPNYAQVVAPLLQAKTAVMSEYRVYYKNEKKSEKTDKPTAHWRDVAWLTFNWTDECEEAFNKIKQRLSSAETLAPANWSSPFVLYCDASYLGYGVALHQVPEGMENKRKNERPILYLSRALDCHERNYALTELEAGCIVWAINKLSHYLDGSQMEIITDHAALQWLLKVKDVPSTRQNNRLLRWSLLLSQYSDRIRITHRPGNSHGNVDGLSRLIRDVRKKNEPSVSVFPSDTDVDLDAEEWSAAYETDASLRLVYNKLSDGTYTDSPKYHSFSLDPLTKRMYLNSRSGKRLVLPVSKLRNIIVETHGQYAHLGAAKTYDRLAKQLWHPLLYRRCFDIVQDCASCRENGIMHHCPYGQAQPIESPAIPFDTVGIDFVTGLPQSGDENFDSFATVTCKFTKVLRIIPTRTDDNAQRFADRFFAQIVRYHGLPRTIISDRDKLFLSKFWAEMLRLNGIKRSMTSPYHPQADGQSEKSNQTVEIALPHCVDFMQADWTTHIPQIELAINSSKNDTTQVSPYSLLYGIDVRDSISKLVGTPCQVPTAEEFSAKRLRIRSRAEGAIAWAQARQAIYYDKNHKLMEFNVGDKVMFNLKDFNIAGVCSDKLGPKRIGPFSVTKRIGRLAYVLDLPDTYKMHNVFSIAKLEKATSDDLAHSRPPGQVEEAEAEYFEVKSILAQRTKSCTLQYLIKWKDYGDESNSWEPAAEIKRGAPDVVRAWNQRRRTQDGTS